MGKGQSNRQQYDVKKLYRTAIREKREMVYKRTPYGIGNPKMVVSSIPADEKAEIMANYFNEVVVPLATEYGLCNNDDEKEKLVGEWAQMNIRRMDDIDEQYVEYKMDFAAAIWILDTLKESGHLEDAKKILAQQDTAFEDIRWPGFTYLGYGNVLIGDMQNLIARRNKDCVGMKKVQRPWNRYILRDSYTLSYKQKQDVLSRKLFDAVIELIPKERINHAVEAFHAAEKDAITRYYRCLAQWCEEIEKKKKKRERLYERFEVEEKRPLQNPAVVFGAVNFAKQKLPSSAERAAQDAAAINKISANLKDDVRGKNLADMAEELKALDDEYDRLLDEAEIFDNECWSNPDWTEQTWKKRFPEKIAEIAFGCQVEDPFEMSFALLYLCDQGDPVTQLSYICDAVICVTCHQLPWTEEDRAFDDDERFSPWQKDERTWKGNSQIFSKSVYDSSAAVYEGEIFEEETGFKTGTEKISRRKSAAKMLYRVTGNEVVLPRNTKSLDTYIDMFRQSFISEDEKTIIFLASCAFLWNEITYTEDTEHVFSDEYSDEEDEDDYVEEDSTKTILEEGKESLTPSKCESPGNSEEVTRLKKELSAMKDALHKAESMAAKCQKEKEEFADTYAAERRELSELRELIYNLQCNDYNDEENIAEEKEDIDFPYTCEKRHVVYGGHDTFLKAIKPLLPNVRFISTLPNSDTIRGADCVWIQTNRISHPEFYKITDAARASKTPIHYFTNASARKSAEQVMQVDKEMSTN